MASARKTTPATARLLSRYYPDRPTDFEHFSLKTKGFLPVSGVVLDLGAGAGIIPELDWRGSGSRRVCGLDLDPRVGDNPFLDQSVIGDASRLPLDNGSIDTVVSVNVFEHLENPALVLREVLRVLKPGARFLIKTPNRSHYIGWISRITPTGFHRWYNHRRGRRVEDTFPTFYRFNHVRQVEDLAREAGFEVEQVDGYEGPPEYLLLAAPLFYFGWVYERWVNSSPSRKRYRANLEIILRKPAA
jgi:SAM-dependent methyltransferase